LQPVARNPRRPWSSYILRQMWNSSSDRRCRRKASSRLISRAAVGSSKAMGSIRACWGTVDPFAQAEFATDSPLEGTGFELPVRERNESGCRARQLGTGRRALLPTDFIGYPTEGYPFGDRGGRVALSAADPSQANGRGKRPTTSFTAPAYWKFESSPLQRRVCELLVPKGREAGLPGAGWPLSATGREMRVAFVPTSRRNGMAR
jgi:hypothetical protein